MIGYDIFIVSGNFSLNDEEIKNHSFFRILL